MSITRAQIVRQLMARGGFARGGNTGYSDFASPSSTTASQDFATQAVSGGQTNYDGGNDTKPTIRTIPEDYFTPSKTGPTIARVVNFLVNPRMISKKIMDDKIKEQYEKELQVAEDVTTSKKYWIWPSNWQSIFWTNEYKSHAKL
jgi:hypothetical protein